MRYGVPYKGSKNGIAEIEKKVTLCSGAGKSQIEKLFVPKSQIKMIKAISEKRYRQLEFDFN